MELSPFYAFCVNKNQFFCVATLYTQIYTYIFILIAQFYCATIAYHVGLNANSGGCRTPANNQEKWTFGTGRVRGLVCTIAVSFCNSSFFSRWPPYWKDV